VKVIPYIEISAADWNTVCEQSADAWLFHRSDWIALEIEHFKYINRSFALQERGHIVAVHPLYVSDPSSDAADERLLHSGVHRHTGLACYDTLDSGVRHAAQVAAMRHIHLVAHADGVHRIQLNAQNLAPANRGQTREEIPFWVLNHGYYLGLNCSPAGIVPAPGMATCQADQVVNLLVPEERLFAGLKDSCRRAVRKAIASKLEFTIVEANAVSRYYDLAKRSAQRTGESLVSQHYFEDIWQYLKPRHRCAIAIVKHEGKDVAALLLGIDKGAATFLGGVSDPTALHLRVNDFMHWQAMLWLKSIGAELYRLGPVFPEVPEDWPIARVSRFKKKFGGRSVPIIQGSYFLAPDRYLDGGTRALNQRCSLIPKSNGFPESAESNVTIQAPKVKHEDISTILACYGLARGPYTFVGDSYSLEFGQTIVFLVERKQFPPNLEICHETTQQYLYTAGQKKPWWHRTAPDPSYRTLLPHVTFSGPGIEPIWVTSHGRAVVAWQHLPSGSANLLIGLNAVEEIIRYRQGDPAKVDEELERSGFGFDFERPNYLYRDQIDSERPHFPWADMLGFFMVEQIAKMSGAPLLEVLPSGLKGLVILTGDDDQAYLEKYEEQLAITSDLPITYFIVPGTRHTNETLKKLPKRIEIGVHPDALDEPQNYDALCRQQTEFVRAISEQPVRTVRNHGFLNRGYLGHLATWEQTGLVADVNCPGTDGTALNGSLLPMRLRRADGSWSDHMSLLTSFGDGMIFGLKLTPHESVKRIARTAKLVEQGHPGAIVFNLHPQNVTETRALHKAIVKLAHRPGWEAIKLGTFVHWSAIRMQIKLEPADGSWLLRSSESIESLVLKVPTPTGWRQISIPRLTESGFVLGGAT
jgi:hypothetical protein